MAKRTVVAAPGKKVALDLVAPSFPVVVVGASAGGLAAFTAFLKALPTDCGLAYVFIQHLIPNRESALTLLLSRATAMLVTEAEDNELVQPDHVYVIPPNRNITIHKGRLILTKRTGSPGLQRPIDNFAIALAADAGSSAIGVILSGTGSDGTDGLRAIKAAGGVTFAQDPKTAEWPDMPASAITAGVADFTLSTKQIAVALAKVGRQSNLGETTMVPEASDLGKLCLILEAATGIDFRLYKQATVRRRISRRMALQKIATLSKYILILKQNPGEAQALADSIFIHVTSFFRDPECFQALSKRVMAKLAQQTPEDTIRIWVSACSTGEEVYSVAMLLMEALGAGAASRRIQIFGTDIQELAVAQARAGVYSEAAMSEVSPARRKRFFAQTDKGWQVEKHIRDICVFARHDLAKDPPFSHLDLVSCRNVLIYMGVELQKRVLSIFQYALRPGRFLFLGTSSSIGDSSDSFAHDDRKHGIFVRKPLPPGPRGISYALNQPYREWSRPPSAHTPALLPLRDLQHEVERSLVEYYAPPAVVVDSGLHIVHFQGDTGPYLAPTTGQPSLHLLKMVRPDLVFDLRAIISSARRTGRVSHKDDVQFEYLGRPAAVRMEARPLGTGRNRSKQELIIVFQKAVPLVAGRPAKGRHITEAARLERELTTTRERLRGLITENGIVVAEMKTANEEALSSNEELQSTNEELETAKEELQSANEELISLNRELQHNNEELKVLSQDLNNLLTGLDIPVLVLDSDLRIRRFTPVAGALFNLMPGDVGRLFGQMANSLNISDWKEVLTEVTVHRRPVQREVTSPLGGRYSLRVHPYQNANNHLDAVLIVMLDMELIARARDDAGAARDLAVKAEAQSLSILNALTAHVAVVASDGVITATNQAWDRFAAEAGPASLQGFGRGANYLDMCGIAANGCSAGAQEARAGIQSILSGQATSFSIEYPCNTADRMLWFLMNVSPLSGPNPGAVVAHADVTVRKQAELALERSDAAIRALMEANPQAIIVTDLNQIIILANFSTQDMFGYTGAELIGLPLDCLIPESNWNQHQEHHWQFGTEMQSGRVSVRSDVFALHKDGRSFRVEVGHSTIETSEGPRAVAFIADISARVEAERALLQTQLQYYSLFENMQEGLAYCRLIQENGIAVDFEYLTVNTKYEAMTGQKNFVGRKLTEVMPGFRDLDREAFNSFVRVSTTGKPETFEAFIVSTNQWYSVSLYRPEKGTFVGVFGSINARKILEDNLRRNEERLRITVEGTGVGTFDSDMSSGKQFWSDTARQLFSIPDGVEVSQELVWQGIHPDDRDRVREQWGRMGSMISQSSGTLIAEFRAESADSIGPRWLALRSRMLPGKEGSTQRIVGIVIDVTERVRLRETIEASRDEVRALAASLLSAAETERSRVAHNLHDRICQQLASLAIDMGGLAEDSESPSLTRDDLKAFQARIVVASEETRHIAYELHPTVLEDLGLIASLQELCREFSASVPDLDIRLKSAVLPAAIQLEAASCVYRVAEEGMNNVVKHAGATHITISLRTRRQSLVMTLSDDGRGFDMQAAKGKGRLGLIGLEERVRLVGGTLAISARKPHGTRIILSIPIGAGKTVRGKTPLKQ